MLLRRLPSKTRELLAVLLLAVFVIIVAIWWSRGHQNPIDNLQKKPAPSSSNLAAGDSPVAPQFNKKQHSINDPVSLWAIVNKGRILPTTYVPTGLTAPNIALRLGTSAPEMRLRQDAASALEQMDKAAQIQGLRFMLASGYRSYAFQSSLYSGYVRQMGQTAADSSSARPGHSEHQTGLAADVEPSNRKCEINVCFAQTPEGKWLALNSYKYGFIIRYGPGKDSLTGYEYEPWHLRYVGSELATQLYQNDQTIEQFFNLPAMTQYPARAFTLGPGS